MFSCIARNNLLGSGYIENITIKFGEGFKINSFEDSFFGAKSTCLVPFMFTNCFAAFEDLNKIDTSSATDLSFMFAMANSYTLDISG